jgi:solute carrier family 35, member E3
MLKRYSFPFIVLINFVSTISIIQLNKYNYSFIHFPNLALTCLHYIVTSICLLFIVKFGVVEFKRIPLFKMIPMSVVFAGSVSIANFSLEYNTVGTYQCFKALTTFIILILEYFIYKEKVSIKIISSVVCNLVFWNLIFNFNFLSINFKQKGSGYFWCFL